MFPDHHRLKGGALQLGAPGPGAVGPFGTWPADGQQDDNDRQERQDLEAVTGEGSAR
ncbi:hypothetical protein ACWDZ6_21255 [Streptomyces sp. NPDC002926]